MTSLIHVHGFDRELNRGRIYANRNAAGKFEGVALIAGDFDGQAIRQPTLASPCS